MVEPPFICPHCDVELHLPDNVWYYTCSHCGKHLDLKSQFAFLRGLDDFTEGQDIVDNMNPKKRHKPFNVLDRTAMDLFKRAYSSLQVAFQVNLEESQRSLGVEMMTSMSQEFIKRNMISPLEANYWNMLMVEQTAQNECDLLKEKLKTIGGSLGFLKRWRWTSRQKKLLKSLLQIDRKIKTLEDQIEFIDLPKARNKNWRP
jgi:hypothetical protein